MRQRLRTSRIERQLQRPSGGTSDATPFIALDATRVTAGHKQPRERKVPALLEHDKRRILSAHPDATFEIVRRGRNNAVRADIARYRVDPSTL
jgi:hypothetical protein